MTIINLKRGMATVVHKHSESQRWRALLRRLGFKVRTCNLIMVDFASRDSRSSARWLQNQRNISQHEYGEALDALLEDPLLSEGDITECLGRSDKSVTCAYPSLPSQDNASC